MASAEHAALRRSTLILLVSVTSKIAINALRTENLRIKLVLKVKETELRI
jgi:hypothetical protein